MGHEGVVRLGRARYGREAERGGGRKGGIWGGARGPVLRVQAMWAGVRGLGGGEEGGGGRGTGVGGGRRRTEHRAGGSGGRGGGSGAWWRVCVCVCEGRWGGVGGLVVCESVVELRWEGVAPGGGCVCVCVCVWRLVAGVYGAAASAGESKRR